MNLFGTHGKTFLSQNKNFLLIDLSTIREHNFINIWQKLYLENHRTYYFKVIIFILLFTFEGIYYTQYFMWYGEKVSLLKNEIYIHAYNFEN